MYWSEKQVIGESTVMFKISIITSLVQINCKKVVVIRQTSHANIISCGLNEPLDQHSMERLELNAQQGSYTS